MLCALRSGGLIAWLARCTPGLTTLLLLALIACALFDFDAVFRYLPNRQERYAFDEAGFQSYSCFQIAFISYGFFLHVVALAFTVRLCRAALHTSIRLENARKLNEPLPVSSEKTDDEKQQSVVWIDYLADDVPEIIHAILIPSYKEEISTLEETLKVLASHEDARSSYHVILAMEERDPSAVGVAKALTASFADKFHNLEWTLHPADIVGEAAGKSSNVGWAAKHVLKKYENSRDMWKNILVTVMDCDTHLSCNYFSLLRSMHTENRGLMSLYVPPIIFDRNSHQVPRLVRVADLIWSSACLSTFENDSSITIPTSVYSLPLTLVHLVDGWDTGPEAIGEDLHMMLKCYFGTDGKLNIEKVASPASQCNIGGGSKKGLSRWLSAHRARYSQGLRHMWGSLDTGYAMTQWAQLGKPGRNIRCLQRSRKPSQTQKDLKLSQLDTQPGPRYVKMTWRNMVLFFRIFEAHFLPPHLIIVMLASTLYTNIADEKVMLPLLWLFFQFTNGLRILSFLTMIFYYVVFYERYHNLCVEMRETEMKRAGLYNDMSDSFSYRHINNWRTWIDYIIFPVAGTVFGSAPAMHATLAHFFTNKLTYVVSSKPQSRGQLSHPIV